MTLVYKRTLDDNTKPRMHALVLGIGRFPHLDDAPNGDRPACADSAREVVKFLVRNEDRFEAKLATIDCLVSDPRNPSRQDKLPKTHPTHDPRPDQKVDAGLRRKVEDICDEWMDRAREGDCLFLYCCSHGVAGVEERGLLVCEDYNERETNKPAYLLNIGSMANSLPAANRAGSVWIFMDACQEVLDELLDLRGGVGGIQPARAGIRDQVSWPVKSTAIVAAQLGQLAYAPPAGGVAYFTETLLHGLENCCVEAHNGQWVVTSRQMQNTLEKLALVLNSRAISTSRLGNTQAHHRLLPINDPQIPVAISTKPEALMTNATQVEIKPRRVGANAVMTKDNAEPTWRCALSLNERLYKVCITNGANNPTQQEFDLDPPSVFVRVEP